MITPQQRVARRELYTEAKAGQLVGAYQNVVLALREQGTALAQYPSNKYSKDTADTLTATGDALRLLGEELREWHRFCWEG